MSYDPNSYGPPASFSPPPRSENQLGLILGIGSVVCGLMAFPLFLCCCTILLSPVAAMGAIGLGIGAVLVPAPAGGGPGRAFGWVGIVSGALALLLFVGLLIFGAVSDTSTSPDSGPFDSIDMPSLDYDAEIKQENNDGESGDDLPAGDRPADSPNPEASTPFEIIPSDAIPAETPKSPPE